MAFGAALLEGAQAALNGAKAAYTNAVKGPDFNKKAYDEAQREPGIGVEADCFEEDWSVVEKPKRRNSSQSSQSPSQSPSPSPSPSPEASQELEPYLIRNTENLSQIRLKLTRTAAAKASEAADVSIIYVKWALKFATLEAAHDIAFLTHCRTVTDAVKAAKSRYPLLEDIQRAYHAGLVDAGSVVVLERKWQPPRAGINHPFDVNVPSNLDGMTIIPTKGNDIPAAAAAGPKHYDSETKAEVEYVYHESVIRGRPSKQQQKKKKLLLLLQKQSKDDDDYDVSAKKSRQFTGDVEFDDVESESVEFGGGFAVKPCGSSMRGSLLHSTGPYDNNDDDSEDDGPIIGSANDSEEIKALEGRKNFRKEAIVETMERRGRTAAVLERLRKTDRDDDGI